MENYWLMGVAVTVFFVFSVGMYMLRRKKGKQSVQDVNNAIRGDMRKILMVVAQEGFQDYEYAVPKKVFEKEGYEVVVASKVKGKARGKLGSEIEVDISLDGISIEDYRALVFVGGPGAAIYQKDKQVHLLLKQFIEAGKIIGAICIAPTILAFAGILKGKKATVWNGDGEQLKILENNGVEYKSGDVVVDGKIVTADGPDSAEQFGKRVLEVLKSL